MDINIKDIAIDKLLNSPIADKINSTILLFEKFQKALAVISNNVDGATTQTLRVGTILTLSIANKMMSGKQPNEFSKEEWKEIAEKVNDYGIMMEGDLYTLFVFDLYAKYIDLSVNIKSEHMLEENQAEILALSDELRFLSKAFCEDQLSETDYVDRCLWICLEALVKLWVYYLSAFISIPEYACLFEAIPDFSLQLIRCKLYAREKAILDEYIANQYMLDDELQNKYDDFLEELQCEKNKYDELIKNAFDPGFRDLLHDSVQLALAVGVSKDEVLDTVEKVDEYFN